MAFTYRLELEDGTEAGDFATAVPNWRRGDEIPLGGGESYRVVDVRPHPTLNGTLVVRSVP